MVLGFYTVPTLFSTYVYGRKHAVLTAVGSVLLVVVVSIANPVLLVRSATGELDKWFDLAVWAGLLIVRFYGNAVGAQGSPFARTPADLFWRCLRPRGRGAPVFDHRSQSGQSGGGGPEYPGDRRRNARQPEVRVQALKAYQVPAQPLAESLLDHMRLWAD